MRESSRGPSRQRSKAPPQQQSEDSAVDPAHRDHLGANVVPKTLERNAFDSAYGAAHEGFDSRDHFGRGMNLASGEARPAYASAYGTAHEGFDSRDHFGRGMNVAAGPASPPRRDAPARVRPAPLDTGAQRRGAMSSPEASAAAPSAAQERRRSRRASPPPEDDGIYFPFGRPGGGAPIRDKHNRVVSTRAGVGRDKRAAYSPPSQHVKSYTFEERETRVTSIFGRDERAERARKARELKASLDAQVAARKSKVSKRKNESRRVIEHHIDWQQRRQHEDQRRPDPAGAARGIRSRQLAIGEVRESPMRPKPRGGGAPSGRDPQPDGSEATDVRSRRGGNSQSYYKSPEVVDGGGLSAIRARNMGSALFADPKERERQKERAKERAKEELRRQIEERKRLKAEKARKEQEEEERFNRKLERDRRQLAGLPVEPRVPRPNASTHASPQSYAAARMGVGGAQQPGVMSSPMRGAQPGGSHHASHHASPMAASAGHASPAAAAAAAAASNGAAVEDDDKVFRLTRMVKSMMEQHKMLTEQLDVERKANRALKRRGGTKPRRRKGTAAAQSGGPSASAVRAARRRAAKAEAVRFEEDAKPTKKSRGVARVKRKKKMSGAEMARLRREKAEKAKKEGRHTYGPQHGAKRLRGKGGGSAARRAASQAATRRPSRRQARRAQLAAARGTSLGRRRRRRKAQSSDDESLAAARNVSSSDEGSYGSGGNYPSGKPSSAPQDLSGTLRGESRFFSPGEQPAVPEYEARGIGYARSSSAWGEDDLQDDALDRLVGMLKIQEQELNKLVGSMDDKGRLGASPPPARPPAPAPSHIVSPPPQYGHPPPGAYMAPPAHPGYPAAVYHAAPSHHHPAMYAAQPHAMYPGGVYASQARMPHRGGGYPYQNPGPYNNPAPAAPVAAAPQQPGNAAPSTAAVAAVVTNDATVRADSGEAEKIKKMREELAAERKRVEEERKRVEEERKRDEERRRREDEKRKREEEKRQREQDKKDRARSERIAAALAASKAKKAAAAAPRVSEKAYDPSVLCENCEEAPAVIECIECEELQCQECADELHSVKKMAAHRRLKLKNAP